MPYPRVLNAGLLGMLLITGSVSAPALADEEDEPARRYTTREERRDEGNKYPITEWMTVSGLLEFEYNDETFTPIDNAPKTRLDDTETTAEAVFEITPLEWVKAEIVYEYDGGIHDIVLDEALVAFEYGDFELELGKLYVPFGEYFSHFVTGPMLEFGETRGRAAVLSYAPSDMLDASLFVYSGVAEKLGAGGSGLDWGFAVEFSPLEVCTIGTSYISDLADSDERFLEETNNRYQSRTDALSGYTVLGFDQIEITAEYVHTLRIFKDLDNEVDKPFAYNLEFQVYPAETLALAFRYEGSSEFEDEPKEQFGVAAVWQLFSQMFLTVEYLEGRFRDGFAEDDFDNELDSVSRFSAQLSIGL